MYDASVAPVISTMEWFSASADAVMINLSDDSTRFMGGGLGFVFNCGLEAE